MGRTVLPYSHVWEEERLRWQKFRRALREDQTQFDRLFELARLHLQAGVYASNPWPLESMLLSMLLEHQKVSRPGGTFATVGKSIGKSGVRRRGDLRAAPDFTISGPVGYS